MSTSASIQLVPSTIKQGGTATACITVTRDGVAAISEIVTEVSVPTGAPVLIGTPPAAISGAETAAVAATGGFVVSSAYGTVGAAVGATSVTTPASQSVGGSVNGHSQTLVWTVSDTQAASDLVAAFNADPAVAALVTASLVGSVVFFTAAAAGAAGNAIVITKTGTGVTALAMSGGADAIAATGKVTVPAADPLAPIGAVVGGNSVSVPWNTDQATTAADLRAAINADPVVNLLVSAGAPASGVITLTAVTAGVAGNSITLTAINSTVSGATLGTGAGTTAGVDAIFATGGLSLSGARGYTDAQVATALASALTSTGAPATVSPSSTRVNVTANAAGANGNHITTTASGSGVTPDAATLTGGADGYYTSVVPVGIAVPAPLTHDLSVQVSALLEVDGVMVAATPATLTCEAIPIT